jgi:FkbM family methyltransferase
MMLSIKCGTRDLYYYDSEDPVVSALKNGVLFGASNFNLLNYFVTHGNTIVDCGAHIGTFSIPALMSGYDVVAIEAAPKNVECLNKTANGFYGKLQVVEAIVSDSQSRCSFSHTIGPFGSIVKDDNGPFTTETLDNICKDLDIGGLKLDIEGGELEALKGGMSIINKKIPILMEVNGHCLRCRGMLPQDIFEFMDSVDYNCYFLEDTPIDPSRIIKINKSDKFPFCVADVICIHRDNLKLYKDLYSINPRTLSQTEIMKIIDVNNAKSNCDCQEYFESIK